MILTITQQSQNIMMIQIKFVVGKMKDETGGVDKNLWIKMLLKK